MAEPESWQVSTNPVEFPQAYFVPAPTGQWARRLADAAAITPGDRVLSIGCGTTVMAPEILDRAKPGGEVAGLDLNEGVVVAVRHQAPDPDWRRRDHPTLPFDDSSFNAVVSQFALSYVPNPAGVLGEMMRVLAPRGRLAAGEWAPLADSPAYAALAAVARDRLGENAAAVFAAPFAFSSEAELLQLCTAAGIAEPRIERQSGKASFPSVNAFVEMEIKGSPLANMADEAGLQELAVAAADRLEPYVEADGRLVFPIEAQVLTAQKM
jgi:ubiquinone/menaquinone biosynthesis C-methylase UbiE